MKLIIQIPCFNEEGTLAETLSYLPREVEGFDTVEWLVVNDGSKDRTVEIAKECCVDHIVDFPVNRGLAKAFVAGINRALEEGADVIVNTDADNQYNADDIPKLVAPIVGHRAHLVVGSRPIRSIEHFSPMKKLLQHLGSWVVRFTSGANVVDAPSGFRAISREASMRLNIFDSYTYTLESIIQAGRSGVSIVSVPIRVNGETRPSRLVRSIPRYVLRSSLSILRSMFVYRPGQTFFFLGLFPLAIGLFFSFRWLAFYFDDSTRSHVPSLILAAIMLIAALLCWLCALLGELHGINRKLLEDIQYQLRRERLGDGRGDQAESYAG
ncbi:glycosyltransferase family 2 protein (plasmid) [Phyllobacterium sp. A18/5-2]|uniref:glycosyltransferase family 2 protein n=1 Tax=Phyllobacterium sp. A18/5-2 TaxID=2978392 RepID=UPI0021C8F577|nr:glycosyltransferase family 2 protein [Phyllobacterium sp. A18/5-2]UXN66683.1 glycosyltransferase family 2 protein [Phyllobacterium sp. A18/5-2]